MHVLDTVTDDQRKHWLVSAFMVLLSCHGNTIAWVW